MRRFTTILCAFAIAVCLTLSTENKASADYPVYYAAPVAPAVVGYTARRGGLFGQRTVVRPLVAPVAAAPVVVARPVVSAFYPPPPVTYVAPVVTRYRVGYPTYFDIYGF